MLYEHHFNPVNAIVCHDGNAWDINCLRRALDILEFEQSEDRYHDEHGEGEYKYPLDCVIELLRKRIWKLFDDMVKQGREYSKEDWLKLKMEHDKRPEAKTNEKK